MAITESQISNAQEKLNNVQTAASRVNEILGAAKRNILTDNDGDAVVSLTSTQKSKLLIEYESAKTALDLAVSDLP